MLKKRRVFLLPSDLDDLLVKLELIELLYVVNGLFPQLSALLG